MPKPAALCGAVLVVATTLPRAARATWYPQMESSDRVSKCVPFNETLDRTWTTLNRRFGVTCTLANEATLRVIATAFRCGPAGLQLFFRTPENCESYKTTLNASRRLDVMEFVPRGLKNPDGWAFDACYEHAAIPENIPTMGLQAITDYCVCTSTRLRCCSAGSGVRTGC
jgi:hypothetical protein